MDEVEFHAPPRESKSKRWLSFHPFSGIYIHTVIYIYNMDEDIDIDIDIGMILYDIIRYTHMYFQSRQ